MTADGEAWRRPLTVAAGTILLVGLVFEVTEWALHRDAPPSSAPPAAESVAAEMITLPEAAPEPSPGESGSPDPPDTTSDPLPETTPSNIISDQKRHPPPPKPRHSTAAPAGRPEPPATSMPASAEDGTPPPVAGDSASHGDTLPRAANAARVIYQPAPVIPAELRRHALAAEARVRFTIAADGSATAELEEATPDPELNRAILEGLRRWRFFPAMRDGRPEASILRLKVPIRIE